MNVLLLTCTSGNLEQSWAQRTRDRHDWMIAGRLRVVSAPGQRRKIRHCQGVHSAYGTQIQRGGLDWGIRVLPESKKENVADVSSINIKRHVIDNKIFNYRKEKFS